MTETATITGTAGMWEANAGFWVKIIHDRRDRYRTELTDDAILAAIGGVAGQRVLDAGCGEGYLSRRLARRGARWVHGIDRSAGLIAAARAAAADADTDTDTDADTAFSEGDLASLPFAGGVFDVAVANHVLNDLPDVAGPARELARVLRPGGRLVALMLHPCFYGDRAETTPQDRALGAADYFTQRAVTQTFEVDGLTSPAASTSWIRPLEAYTGALAGAGLHITSLAEPHPTAEQVAGSAWWRENFPRPLFMLFTAVKPAVASVP